MKLKNYCMDHFKGNLSLPRSYWLNGFYIIFPSLPIAALYLIFNTQIFLLLAYPIQLFWIIGVWRAAKNYNGHKAWKLITISSIILVGTIWTVDFFSLFMNVINLNY